MLSSGRHAGSGVAYVADDLRFWKPELMRSKGADPAAYDLLWCERKRVSPRR